MLRSNPSARAGARAWAAVLLPLLILQFYAWAPNAINLNLESHTNQPFSETPWLPFGKIFGVRWSLDTI
jgi:hypothetical protein